MARRLRKRDAVTLNYLVFLAIVIGAISAGYDFVKTHVADPATQQFWIPVGIAVAAWAFVGSWKRRRRRKELEAELARADLEHQTYLEQGAKRALAIAQSQGWVSAHRLKTQARISDRQAQDFLEAACNMDMLYQAANGRYYCDDLPDEPKLLR